MKKRVLVGNLKRNGCYLLRQGRRHEWWQNRTTGNRSAVPRHSEIPNILVNKICRDLDVALLA
ncbi:MAG: type II toxin-antitoxin system HicA family toxin [Gammaproteobacteria bacterium]|nr:type II toxin-antitoxin system HicA family toxin [Gammaproteobacteria bacterium]